MTAYCTAKRRHLDLRIVVFRRTIRQPVTLARSRRRAKEVGRMSARGGAIVSGQGRSVGEAFQEFNT